MKIGVLGFRGSIGFRHYTNIMNMYGKHTYYGYDPCIIGGLGRGWVIEHSDAIVVASPSKHHAHDLTDAIDAGKHVLVEKPFGYDCPPYLDSYVKGARMRRPELIIATGFNLRFHACVKKAKELIPELGNIICASFTVYQKTTKPLYLQDGILRNWCSHEIDLAHYLLGDLVVESALAPQDENGNDTIEAWITMDSPAIKTHCFLQADYYSDPEHRYFFIEGDRGGIWVNLVDRTVLFRKRGEDYKLVLKATDTYDQNYLEEMSCFIRSIELGCHQAPLATGEDGIKCLYSIMAAREKTGLVEEYQKCPKP
jgi:predicted dehydrogenase